MQAEAYLKTLRDRLTTVAADLDAMPRERAGSEWHRDRIDEARWIVKEIGRIEARTPAAR